jgi:4-hydroxy-3-methylbut-2-en-1-yl diphosphate synthase IspG/GcpE
MKKFIILASLILSTGSAFADVTLTTAEVEKIEAHIITLDNQIIKLTEEKQIQANALKKLTKELNLLKAEFPTSTDVLIKTNVVLSEAQVEKIRKIVSEEVLNKKEEVKKSQIVKMSKSGICHTPFSSYYTRTKNFTPFNSLTACLNAGGRNPK